MTKTPPTPETEEQMSPLRRARMEKGLSQLKLSIAADVNIGTVAASDNGAFIGPRTAKKLAAVLGINPADLMRPTKKR